MIVCHCHGVTDRRIRQAIREGAASRGRIARACGAGRSCGGCAPVLDQILSAEETPEIPAPVGLSEPAVVAS